MGRPNLRLWESLNKRNRGRYTNTRVVLHMASLQRLFMLESKAKQRVRALDVELAAHVRAMVFYRAVMDRDLVTDFLARQAVGDQLQIRRSDRVRSRSNGFSAVVFAVWSLCSNCKAIAELR